MKDFIGIVFIGIVFSFFLIPAINAGPSDVWKECKTTTECFKCVDQLENKFCTQNTGSWEWRTSSDPDRCEGKGDNTWECNGNTRKQRSYTCNTAGTCNAQPSPVCLPNLVASEDCTTKVSVDSDNGNAPLTAGTVTDYTTCTNAATGCDSVSSADSCSFNTLTEYCVSNDGATCSATGSTKAWVTKNCEDFEALYCNTLVGDISLGDIFRNEWQCSGAPGFCNDGATDTKTQDCSNTCSDTDGGQIFTTQGTVTDNNLCSSGQTACPSSQSTDACVNAETLTEYYCSGNDQASVAKNCNDLNSVTYDTITDACSWSDYGCSTGKCSVATTNSLDCDSFDSVSGASANDYEVSTSSCILGCTDSGCCFVANSPKTCSTTTSCQSTTVEGTSYKCHRTNAGTWQWDTAMTAETACSDGFDNDCDGLVDLLDFDCDSTPPTTTASATSPPDTTSYTFNTPTRNDVKITLSCTDNLGGSGCSTTKYCTDTLDTCTPSITLIPFTISAEGITYVRYRSTDNTGNAETIQSRLVNIDRTAPATSIVSVDGDTTSPYMDTSNDGKTDIVVLGEASMNCRWGTTDVTYSSMSSGNECLILVSTATCSLGALSPGTHTRSVSCRDSAGNEQTIDSSQPTGNEDVTFNICVRSNPTVTITPASQNGEPGDTRTYTVSVTNIDQNCGTEGFDLTKTGCPTGWTCTLPSSLSIASGSSQTATLSITSSPTAAAGVNTINVEAKNQADNPFRTTAFATYSVICVNRQAIKPTVNFNTATKAGEFFGVKNTWTLSFTDSSSSSCALTTQYSITHPTDTTKLFQASGACHSNTGLYSVSSTPPAGTKLLPPYTISLPRGGELNNAFKVYVERNGDASCTLSFVARIGSTIIDPSFTVGSGTGPKQAPHVGLVDFSGDKSLFNVKWEAFYPDNEPFRDMKVKCALFNPTDNSCDPGIQDCSGVAGKVCSPYDAAQGTAEVKKGSCDVSSPGFDFNNNNKIICIFYDPSDITLKTRVEPSFTPIDFAITTTNKIVATVGEKFDLKIDVGNKGALKDSYKIDLSGPATIDISPTTITTQAIDPNQVVSVFSSITPLVDQTGTLTVKVTSLTSGKFVTREIEVSPGLLALPEFGLIGFLQIIAVAAIVYFLLVNRFVELNLKKKRKRR